VSFTSLMATSAPAWASSRAVARPMPDAPPVTSTTWPERGGVTFGLSLVASAFAPHADGSNIIWLVRKPKHFPLRPGKGAVMPIKVVTICGSVRPGNYTAKALRLALDEFARHKDVEVTPIFF